MFILLLFASLVMPAEDLRARVSVKAMTQVGTLCSCDECCSFESGGARCLFTHYFVHVLISGYD